VNVRGELDHLAFAVADVAATQQALCGLGFQTTALGACLWRDERGAQSARCVSVVFPAHYLDFIESPIENGKPRAQSSRMPPPAHRFDRVQGIAYRHAVAGR
jgi:hypothetical protein